MQHNARPTAFKRRRGSLVHLQVASGDGWPLVVAFRGIAAHDAEPRTHVLWLRRHLDRLIVAGTPQEQIP